VRRYLLFAGLILCLLLARPSFTQDRFDSGPHKGFKRSPTEHIIMEIEEPFEVQSVHGVIQGPAGESLPDADFEIRGKSGRVRRTRSDKLGKFRISGRAAASYRFKATKDGFQSITGTVVVSKTASKKSAIILQMKLGV